MKWIKCSERMPENEQTVLVWHGHYEYQEILEWTGKQWSPLYYSPYRITHWMPLPDPPEGDE